MANNGWSNRELETGESWEWRMKKGRLEWGKRNVVWLQKEQRWETTQNSDSVKKPLCFIVWFVSVFHLLFLWNWTELISEKIKKWKPNRISKLNWFVSFFSLIWIVPTFNHRSTSITSPLQLFIVVPKGVFWNWLLCFSNVMFGCFPRAIFIHMLKSVGLIWL